MPVGYKNGTDGSLQVAIDAMQAARHPHSFLGIDADGKTCIVNTKGNPWGFLILRGGRSGPNYSSGRTGRSRRTAGLRRTAAPRDGRLQPREFQQGLPASARRLERLHRPARAGNENLIGLMLESNLLPGNQPLPRRSHATRIRHLGHRRLHRLGRNRTPAPLGLRATRRRAAGELRNVETGVGASGRFNPR